MDESLYSEKQKAEFEKYEAQCQRCGACCGANDCDPCIELAKDAQGKWFCRVYEARLGFHQTVSGKVFYCLPIRDLSQSCRPANCAYAKTNFS